MIEAPETLPDLFGNKREPEAAPSPPLTQPGAKTSGWPFGDLMPFRYGKIAADPPWWFDLYSKKGESKSPHAHYALMPDAELLALPVGQLAGRDCALWMWATAPRLDFAHAVLRAWGFQFVTAGTWHKTTVHRRTSWGTGYWLRSVSEFFLIGKIGNPPIDLSFAARTPNLFRARRREHSRKPPNAHRYLDGILPNEFGCELFARQSRAGWDCWGNEASKFDPAPDKGGSA